VFSSNSNMHHFDPRLDSLKPDPSQHDICVPFSPAPLSESESSSPSCSFATLSSQPHHSYTGLTKASLFSSRFPPDHHLDPSFVRWYNLEDELGAGGYGFVMTARHRLDNAEVAVKFIIKAKVPEHAWMEDKSMNRVPTEALLLGLLDHRNIVKCVDIFEDDLYFYLVTLLFFYARLCADRSSVIRCRSYMAYRGSRSKKVTQLRNSRRPRVPCRYRRITRCQA
jgi:Protein kinase domain